VGLVRPVGFKLLKLKRKRGEASLARSAFELAGRRLEALPRLKMLQSTNLDALEIMLSPLRGPTLQDGTKLLGSRNMKKLKVNL
jgi:hypothetical protein